MPTEGHIDAQDLEQYAMGHAPEETAARIEEHLLVCEACRAQLAQTDAYVAAMRKAAAELRDREAKPEKGAGQGV
ncbi:MAG TPA: zf-HC2 domain-containing protein [Bryobacteraceae bacterium]|jgi:anti-sigma factor RsiW